jgi:hypothetical protein
MSGRKSIRHAINPKAASKGARPAAEFHAPEPMSPGAKATRDVNTNRKLILSQCQLLERRMVMLDDPDFAASIPEEEKALAKRRLWDMYAESAEKMGEASAVVEGRVSSMPRRMYEDSTGSSDFSSDVDRSQPLSQSSSVAFSSYDHSQDFSYSQDAEANELEGGMAAIMGLGGSEMQELGNAASLPVRVDDDDDD